MPLNICSCWQKIKVTLNFWDEKGCKYRSFKQGGANEDQ